MLSILGGQRWSNSHVNLKKAKLGEGSKENVAIAINEVILSWSRYRSLNWNPRYRSSTKETKKCFGCCYEIRKWFLYARLLILNTIFVFIYFLSFWISISSSTGTSISVLDKKVKVPGRYSDRVQKFSLLSTTLQRNRSFKKSSHTG